MTLTTATLRVSLTTDSYNNYDGFRMNFKTSGDVVSTTSGPESTTSSEGSTVSGESTTSGNLK